VRWQPIGIAGPTGNFVERGVRFVHRVVVLRHAIQSTDPGVVISFMDRVNVLTLVASAANPYPVIVSVHEDPERSNLGRGWRIARRLLYPRAAKIAVLTHAALAQFPTAIRRPGI
jgi:hypothetical protein